jgi:hypothetical protein
MNILYFGKYLKRFRDIFSLLGDANTVLDLCFGDTHIAELCRKHHKQWIGYDLNKSFVDYAVSNNYQAFCKDILNEATFPKSDAVIMVGSLYHFHLNLDELFHKIFQSSSLFIISEPVRNLSSMNGIVGYVAKKSAKVGKGDEAFRFTEQSLIANLELYRKKYQYTYEVISIDRDMVIKVKI